MPTKPKKARELLSLADLDQRSQAAIHATGLRDRIIADRGGADRLSALEIEQIENAAMTSAVLRSVQCRWAKKEPISPDERAVITTVATIQNTFNRLCEAVGVGRVARDVTPSPAEYFAAVAKEEDSK